MTRRRGWRETQVALNYHVAYLIARSHKFCATNAIEVRDLLAKLICNSTVVLVTEEDEYAPHNGDTFVLIVHRIRKGRNRLSLSLSLPDLQADGTSIIRRGHRSFCVSSDQFYEDEENLSGKINKSADRRQQLALLTCTYSIQR